MCIRDRIQSDNATMADEVNCDLPVVCTVSHRVYSAPSRFENVDILDDVELIVCAHDKMGFTVSRPMIVVIPNEPGSFWFGHAARLITSKV